ncbi:hypothetical protein OAA09_00050 [bacterium]|nr:hypothetical protein [bacterium]
MKTTYITIILLTTFGLPAYGYHFINESAKAAEVRNSPEEGLFCIDRSTSLANRPEKSGVIVKMKPFIIKTSAGLHLQDK